MTISDIAKQAALINRSAARDENGYRIEMTREYDYPIDDVWSAWTSPERLRRWLGETLGELRVGGRVDLVMDPESVIHLVIRECERPSVLSATWQAGEEIESEVRLEFEALGDGRTRLRLTHCRLELDQALDIGPGWEEFLYVLDVFLAGRSVSDVPWDRHGVVGALADDWGRVIAAANG